jgi:hypothetical protein
MGGRNHDERSAFAATGTFERGNALSEDALPEDRRALMLDAMKSPKEGLRIHAASA